MKKVKSGKKVNMGLRILAVWFAMLVPLFAVIAVRLGYIMVINSDFYQKKAAEQQLYDSEITADRGIIYDCNMEVLAKSATVWTVYMTPNEFKNVKKDEEKELIRRDIAAKLTEILALDYDTVYEYTQRTSRYVTVLRNVEKPEADKIREYISSSDYGIGNYIGLTESSKRYYPNDNLAADVLGFVGTDNQGLAGLELYYDESLTGTAGRVVAAKDALGVDMPYSYEVKIEPKQGNSLVTTIDSRIQYICEKYLTQAVEDNKCADRGAVIAMNVNTGAVVALAVKGDFNPNQPFTLSEADQAIVDALEGDEKTAKLSELRNKQWRNKVVSDTYEPGSVFKIVTLAAALEENVTNSSKYYNCAGTIVVAGQRYKCATRAHNYQSLAQAVSNSCNVAFITLGQLLGANNFSKYFEAFGLTQKTNIDLPGEASSNYHKVEKMGITELASSSFGQTFNVTPIQMITAVATAVNGGNLVQPHVVSEIVDADGNTVSKTNTNYRRQVISTETSTKICEMLEGVVDGGGGKNAYVSGYRIGGKTGTAEKLSKNLATGEKLYIASFAGIAPIDDPEIAILIMLDEPTAGAYYGGTIAAPVGGQIFAEILPYLGYEPQYSDEELKKLAISVPDLIGKTVASAKTKLSQAGLVCKVVGDGDTVINQLPAANQSIYTGGTVIIYTEEDNETLKTTVPDFTNLTVGGVSELAARHNINVVYRGSNLTDSGVTSYKQSVSKGTEIQAGAVVTVYFRANDINE